MEPLLPTPALIERYIKFADAELGPECCDPWVEVLRQYLRAWPGKQEA